MSFKVTAQGIPLKRTCFKEQLEVPCDAEFTLPDYCPDISRVLKCKIGPRVNSKNLNGSALTIEGVNAVTLLYADDDNQIRSYEYTQPFSKVMDIGHQESSCNVTVSAQIDYVNAKAVSQRKMDVHGATSLKITGCCTDNINVVNDIDCQNVETSKENIKISNTVNSCEKHLNINQDVTLPAGKQSIRNIVRYDAKAITGESKVISNKVVVKGELLLSILYCGDTNGALETYECSIPISQIIEIEGLNDECQCSIDIDLCSEELKPRTSTDGEVRNINVNSKSIINITTYCQTEIPVVCDAYSTKHPLTCFKENVPVKNIVTKISETKLVKKVIDISNNNISSVIDVWCENVTTNTQKENSNLILSGDLLLCALYIDVENSPNYIEQVIDFEFDYDLVSSAKEISTKCTVVPTATSYTIQSDQSIEARVELLIKGDVFEKSLLELLVDAEIDETQEIEKVRKSPLIIYYADAGENVWNIARSYQTSAEEIMQLNNLDDKKLNINKMLLIPSVK